MTSQTAEYALRAVVCLAERPDERVTTAELAEQSMVPAGYLSKVLQALARSGLVQARRGQHGGYRLARSAETLTVLNVVDAVDPIPRLTACPLDCAGLHSGLCTLHEQLDRAWAAAAAVFASLTIAELLRQSPVRPVLCSLLADRIGDDPPPDPESTAPAGPRSS